jgi:predicted flap endonuclease-1-like 5' DNA nuclease
MWFLFLEIWVWLLIAFVLGWFAHWFFCCRNKEVHTSTASDNDTNTEANALATSAASGTANSVSEIPISDSWKPLGFSQRPDDADDLKRVKGIGGVIEGTLNELGIFKFDQISAWTDDNVAWVDNFISFPGRIEREDWRRQAKALASGHVTEFAARVDKGDVDY